MADADDGVGLDLAFGDEFRAVVRAIRDVRGLLNIGRPDEGIVSLPPFPSFDILFVFCSFFCFLCCFLFGFLRDFFSF